tara:strand:- start:172 stop:570 length:399 start_codon:yes stop_codon:yes gene_type:complete
MSKKAKNPLSLNERGYLMCGGIPVHRIVYERTHGKKPKGMQIDHINGDILDNRVENLRIATYAENQWNAKKRVDNTSGVKGVCWKKNLNKWYAQIKHNKELLYLGVFKDKKEAEKVVRKKREELHGEFARHA